MLRDALSLDGIVDVGEVVGAASSDVGVVATPSIGAGAGGDGVADSVPSAAPDVGSVGSGEVDGADGSSSSAFSPVTRSDVNAPPELLTEDVGDVPPEVDVVLDVPAADAVVVPPVAAVLDVVEPVAVEEVAELVVDGPSADSFDPVEFGPEDVSAAGSATATGTPCVVAHPTPNATARAPTRPTYLL